jgi:hypothetical protein
MIVHRRTASERDEHPKLTAVLADRTGAHERT